MQAAKRRRGRPETAHPGIDRGADGPAMLARPFVMVTIEDDTEASDGSRQFTRSEVPRYRETVIDMYAAKGILHGRRLEAAVALAEMYQEGRVAPSGWRQAGVYGGGEMSDARAEAWRQYCRALDHIPKRCESVCMDVARGMWPAGMRAVELMQEGFAALADHWRLPLDKGY